MNDKNTSILASISIEARTEVIKELMSDVAILFDKSEEKVTKLIEVLKHQKEAVGHGAWLPYLRDNFGGDAAVQRVQHFMRKRSESNKSLVTYLDDGDSKPETAPRSERKPADVKISIPVDPDPTPDPPSIRTTAKGSEKVTEDKKPRTQTVTVEILDDEPDSLPEEKTLADWSVSEIFDYLEQSASDAKKRAKELRKLADKLDPPTKFVKPDIDDVKGYFTELKSMDADSFFDFYESKGWIVGKVSMRDWRASARKWVRENSGGNGHDSRNTKSSGSVSPRIPPNITGSKIKSIRVGG